MKIAHYPESDLPELLRAQALELQQQAWPSAPGEPRDVRHDPALHPTTLLLLADDGATVLAALDILSKQLTHQGHGYAVSGLSRVVADRAHSGRGHGRRLVTAARETIALSGADLGLFTCDTPLRGFYESAGWQCLPGTVLLGGTPDQPFPSDRPGFDKVTMAALLSPAARAHAPDFRHARIALYPGSVDRLW